MTKYQSNQRGESAKHSSVKIEELSQIICWTRMQAEAGQCIEDIILRKELERQSGEGLFCWGIGNPPPRRIGEIAKNNKEIDVVFSLMKSQPKNADMRPEGIVVWRTYFDVNGVEKELPPNILITSRKKSGRRAHYALMCSSENNLELEGARVRTH